MERKAFHANRKHQYHVPWWEEQDYGARNKRIEIIMGIQFFTFHEWTLIIRKMIERKALPANPKRQYRVSQWEEHDCHANNKKNEDYYRYPSFLIPRMNVNFKENDGKKCFSSKSKALMSCILMRRT